MRPQVGWGDSPTAAARPEGGTSQKATAGWLSMLSVFEPHWQVRGWLCRGVIGEIWYGRRTGFDGTCEGLAHLV